MYKINFNHLYYFITIVNTGSIVKASAKLNITQPALSHQLRQLEEDLGHKLFDRKGRGLAINEYGEKVFKHANTIFRETGNMLDSLKTDNRQQKKTFKIGVVSWIPEEYTYQFLKVAHANSNIKLLIQQGDPSELTTLLEQDQLDMIISDVPYSGSSELISSQKLTENEIVCVANPSFSEQSKRFPEYLNSHMISNYRQSSQMRSLVDIFLIKNKLKPEVSTTTNNIKLMLKLVANSETLAFVPKEAAKEYIKEKKVKQVKILNDLTLDIWIIVKKQNSFKDLIRKSVIQFK